MNPKQLTGRSTEHLVELDAPRCTVHTAVRGPLLAMRAAAAESGFDLTPVSAFRDFERQLYIWNEKYAGRREVLDAAARPLDVGALGEDGRIDAILRWSALPGASRHHWGSDLDLIDRAALAADARVALLPSEFAPGGPFAAFAAWLDRHAADFGFFRPFRGEISGVAPEPWHLSYAAVAEPCREALTPSVLRAALSEAPLLGKDRVLARLEELHERFVARIDPPPARLVAGRTRPFSGPDGA